MYLATKPAKRETVSAVVGPVDLAQILRVETHRQRRRTNQIAEHDGQLLPLCLGPDPHPSLPRMRGAPRRPPAEAGVPGGRRGLAGDSGRGLSQRLRRLWPERGDRLEHDFAMTEQDIDFLEIGFGQLGQYFQLDGVVAKCLGVPLQRQTA
jgi:hypothetical protein